MSRSAVVLIDGEHYPEVVRAALEELGDRYDFRAAVFLGGTEKIKSRNLGAEAHEIYGLPVVVADEFVTGLVEALDRFSPEVVVDASDEPVLDYRSRFRLISHALAHGVAYEGADFSFRPPTLDRLAETPSLSIIGTGKRVGKTAVSGFVARSLRRRYEEDEGAGVVIVPMGRGGPAEPEVIEGLGRRISASDLLCWSREGRHAASDHFEDAVLSRVTTVGCRRCGGGLAGEALVTNVSDGARIANDLEPSFTIYEGSGAVMPPVETDARLLVTGAHQPVDYVAHHLGTYRVLISDAVILAMAEEPLATAEDVETVTVAIREIKPNIAVIPVVFRPAPMEDVAGRRAAVFTTAPYPMKDTISHHLETQYGCDVVAFSGNLSNRQVLRDEIELARTADPDVFLTEIKAAAIDVVAEEADRCGCGLVFMDNVPVERSPAQDGDLARLCVRLADTAERRFEGRRRDE